MSRSTYYHTCPNCGAALDPGERCECERMNRERVLTYMDCMDAVQLRGLAIKADRIYVGAERVLAKQTVEKVYSDLRKMGYDFP